uniref:Uncharacterized protein n=1 Tax=Sphaerodactylus townsendi TaxID=933632 RepID=A0ACB8EEW8_9SAUR
MTVEFEECIKDSPRFRDRLGRCKGGEGLFLGRGARRASVPAPEPGPDPRKDGQRGREKARRSPFSAKAGASSVSKRRKGGGGVGWGRSLMRSGGLGGALARPALALCSGGEGGFPSSCMGWASGWARGGLLSRRQVAQTERLAVYKGGTRRRKRRACTHQQTQPSARGSLGCLEEEPKEMGGVGNGFQDGHGACQEVLSSRLENLRAGGMAVPKKNPDD